jgi:uncharacterized membrane protein YeaQ/YmgE (transglycosylase-associated protein family)
VAHQEALPRKDAIMVAFVVLISVMLALAGSGKVSLPECLKFFNFRALAAVGAMGVVGLTIHHFSKPGNASLGITGLGCAAILLVTAGAIRSERPAFAVGIGVAVASLDALLGAHLSPAALALSQITLVAFAGIFTLLFAPDERPGLALASVAASAVVVLNFLSHGDLGCQLGLLLTAVTFVFGFVPSESKRAKLLKDLGIASCYAIVSWVAIKFWIKPPDPYTLPVVVLGVLAGLIVSWLLPDEEDPDILRRAIAAIIWCSVATVAYGEMKETGIALSLLGALVVIAIGNLRAVTSLTVLIGLSFYRVFRATHPDIVRAIDIGQHYALIGVAVGMITAHLPQEWHRHHPYPEGKKASIGLAVWLLVLCSVPALVAMVLSEKGEIGFAMGLALASIVGQSRAAKIPAMVAGIGAFASLSYPLYEPLLEYSREDKVHGFEIATVGLVVAGALLAALARGKQEAV